MPRITSLEDLSRLQVELVIKHSRETARGTIYVTVGMASCGLAAGALEAYRALEQAIEARGLKNVVLSEMGCLGLCTDEPIVEVTIGGGPKVSYGCVTPALARRIVEEHIVSGAIVSEAVIAGTAYPSI